MPVNVSSIACFRSTEGATYFSPESHKRSKSVAFICSANELLRDKRNKCYGGWRDADCPIWLNGQRTAANWKTATRASLRRCVQAPEARGRSALISVVHLGHNGTVPSSMTTDEKLDWIIETLKRMEARQVELKTGVDDVQAHEAVGSFASADTGKKA